MIYPQNGRHPSLNVDYEMSAYYIIEILSQANIEGRNPKFETISLLVEKICTLRLAAPFILVKIISISYTSTGSFELASSGQTATHYNFILVDKVSAVQVRFSLSSLRIKYLRGRLFLGNGLLYFEP